MKSISDLLSKFTKLIKDSSDKLEIISHIIKKNTGIDIPTTAITQSNNTIFISVHPAIKSEIALRKEAIINALKAHKIIVSDIR